MGLTEIPFAQEERRKEIPHPNTRVAIEGIGKLIRLQIGKTYVMHLSMTRECAGSEKRRMICTSESISFPLQPSAEATEVHWKEGEAPLYTLQIPETTVLEHQLHFTPLQKDSTLNVLILWIRQQAGQWFDGVYSQFQLILEAADQEEFAAPPDSLHS